MKYSILIFKNSWSNSILTYESKIPIKDNTIVEVPYGKTIIYGVVIKEVQTIDFDESKLKSVTKSYDLSLPKQYVKFLLTSSNRYGINMSSVISHVINRWVDFMLKKEIKMPKQCHPKGSNNRILITGLPGTGKTFKIISDLKKYKNSKTLYIVPNISMIQIIKDKLKNLVGDEFLIYHSSVGIKESRKVIELVGTNNFSVIIGTRSALFLPFTNLDYIIIDEFHDNSLQQFNSTKHYRSIDVSEMLREAYGSTLILISATPSLEYFVTANKKGWGKVINYEYKREKPNIEYFYGEQIAQERKCVRIIEDLINKKQKALIILNRRGYGTKIVCHNESCPNTPLTCTKSKKNLVYHSKKDTFICHQSEKKYPKQCPVCLSSSLLKITDMGVERIAEKIQASKTNSSIKIISSDYVSKEDIVKEFKKNYDVIIGTSIVQQGIHEKTIKNVLFFDYQSEFYNNVPEFKIKHCTDLIQSIGRVFNNKGSAYIFSNMERYEDKHIQNLDIWQIYYHELRRAKLLGYPPYTNMYCINTSQLQELKDKGIKFEFRYEDRITKEQYITTDLSIKELPIYNVKIIGLKKEEISTRKPNSVL